MTHATWMNLKIIMLRKGSQIQKSTLYMIPVIHNSKKPKSVVKKIRTGCRGINCDGARGNFDYCVKTHDTSIENKNVFCYS